MDAHEITTSILGRINDLTPGRAPAFRLWDGTVIGDSRTATVVLRHPGALRALLLPPSDLTAGEAYVFDDVDFEGDIFEVLGFAAELEAAARPRTLLRLVRDLRRLPADHRRKDAVRPAQRGRLHSKRRDLQAIQHHYDTGTSFFAEFLGSTMVYSCGYFLRHFDDLDTAQRRKLDVICRKLDLAPGARLLDVGCGWGALAIHAARDYGATVLGVTLSEEQAAYGANAVREAGLEDRVTIRLLDYRDVSGEFDAIASVGMFEHVGRKELGRYFGTLRGLLAPGGRLLNHGITTRDRVRRRHKPTFVNTYVFPDGELVPVELVVAEAEGSGFELRDLESLRMSYALTLRHWVANLEANREAAIEATNEQVYRIWRLYMAGSAVAFERAAIAVYQLLLTDPETPWTFGRRRLLAEDDVAAPAPA